MPTPLLSIGPPTIVMQMVVYALPVKPCVVTTTVPLEKSLDGVGSWVAFISGTLTNGGGFIRCPTATPTVICAPAVPGSGGGSVSGDITVTSVAVGATPALTGAVRLTNNQYVKSRNSGNSADVNLVGTSGSSIEVGQAGVDCAVVGSNTYFGNGPILLNALTPHIGFVKRASGGPAGVANWGYMWLRDNGSGKMQLVMQFPTGAVVQIAIEP